MSRPFAVGLFVAALMLAVCLATWLAIARPWLTPEQVLRRFYTQLGAEDMLMDPLILGGEKVAKIVVKEVSRRDMPRRRYAIGFLGNAGYAGATPILKAIVDDETEHDYIRADALKAVYQVDRSLGSQLAQLHVKRHDDLGEMARHIMNRSGVAAARRTYLDALLRRHD